MKKILLTILLITNFCLTGTIFAGTWNVIRSDDNGEGSLRWAINQLNQSTDKENTINFDSNAEEIHLQKALPEIKKNVTLYGGGYTKNVTISIDSNVTKKFTLLKFSSNCNTGHLIDLTLKGGKNDKGGGIYTHAKSLKLTNCNIDNNTASDYGGGIFIAQNSQLFLLNCNIVNNNSNGAGGGIYSNGKVEIEFSNIKNNSTDTEGGGIYNSEKGTLLITNTVVSDCGATNEGGGICNYKGYLYIKDCVLENNGAEIGGALLTESNYKKNNCSIINTKIEQNKALLAGGGITGGALMIDKCTIKWNQCTSFDTIPFGGGINCIGSDSMLTIKQSIIQDNYLSEDPYFKGGGGIHCLKPPHSNIDEYTKSKCINNYPDNISYEDAVKEHNQIQREI